ncbi:MAG TPA: D-2-hydroxyacid dehydrogenase [Nitrososphaeraceae archaeon]|jgi:D-3-phosphoglycerate dehydrogenase / 2-oxoglutarate reductase
MQITGNILVCDPISKIGITILKKAGLNVVDKPSITNSELLSEVENYDVIVVRSRTKITNEVISNAKKAKIIARVGVGLDNIDVDSARQNNIEVVNSPESAINAVAELVMGLMLSLARNLPLADREMKKGYWMKKELTGIELRGKYLGIVGVGNIGRNLARIARALRMNIIGYDIFPIKQDFINEVGMITTDFNTLVASSDFISCHVPSTPDTMHMFNESTFSNMKSTAFFINSSRGEIVDENALYNALTTKKIAGAALDVFEEEPATNKKLLQLSNIICTPHIGAQTKESQELASNVIAEKIIQKLLEKYN